MPRAGRARRHLLPSVLWLAAAYLASPTAWPHCSGFVAPPATRVTKTSCSSALPAERGPMAVLPLLAVGSPVSADAGDWDVVASALVAYGHYAGILLLLALVVVERLTIKANMSREEETRFLYADSAIGVASILLAGTGYLRVVQYGKGWEYYQHEPIFWLKVTLVAISGAASFFVTTMVVKRTVAVNEAGGAPVPPVSEKLANRVTSILNAELLAFFSVPLTATLMARGVGYAEWFPWQVGAASAGLALFGLGFKYIKEALDWTDDVDVSEGGTAAALQS